MCVCVCVCARVRGEEIFCVSGDLSVSEGEGAASGGKVWGESLSHTTQPNLHGYVSKEEEEEEEEEVTLYLSPCP